MFSDLTGAEAPVEIETEAAPLDPLSQVAALREAIATEPDKAELKLDLALALIKTGDVQEASQLLDALPANLATDDRAIRARARLDFHAALAGAPSADALAHACRPMATTCRPTTCSASTACWAARTRRRWSSSWKCSGSTATTAKGCRARR